MRFYNFVAGDPFFDEITTGLSRPQKRIARRFMFDETGAQIFAALCQRTGHLQSRAEISLLRDNRDAIGKIVGEGAQLVEFRTGIGVQAAILVDLLHPPLYMPVDLDGVALERASRDIAQVYGSLNISGMRADILTPLVLPEFTGIGVRRKALLIAGGLLGSFEPEQALSVLRGARRILGRGGVLIAGVDMPVDPAAMEQDYDDEDGLMAQWHQSLLARINRDLQGDFQVNRYSYRVEYEPAQNRVALRLQSEFAQFAHAGGRRIQFAPGEAIDVGAVYPYSIAEVQDMAKRAGFSPDMAWPDPEQRFAVHVMTAV